MKTFLLPTVAAVVLSGCTKAPEIRSTRFNLGFEYTLCDTLPAQWELPDTPFHGYAASADDEHPLQGTRCLRMTQTDPGKTGWAIFSQRLPSQLVAGREIGLGGYIRTEQVGEGAADLYLASLDELDFRRMLSDASDRGVRGTSGWTRIHLKKRIAADSPGVVIGGLLRGGGTAWFDRLELTIDGEPYVEGPVATLKTRLTRREKAELRRYMYPLRSADPGPADDLRILDSLVAGGRVVALGENSHGSSPIYRMKHRLVRYLAERHGFDIFALEEGMAESERLNAYLREGQGDPAALIGALTLWPWKTREMLDLVKWMRFFNRSGKRICWTGFDMQSTDGPIDVLCSAFAGDERTLRLLQRLRDELKEALDYSSGILARIAPDRADTILRELAQVEARIERLPADERQLERLRRHAALVRQFLGQGPSLWRDRCMADNVLWTADRNPASRIVVWAHNGHIQRSGGAMGDCLHKALGDAYRSFGFTFYEGTYTGIRPDSREFIQQAQRAFPGTLEYLLGQLGEERFLLDLKHLRAEDPDLASALDRLRFRHVGALKTENEFQDARITEAFDYLVFIRTSTPTQLGFR